jgi:hypothetical protein
MRRFCCGNARWQLLDITAIQIGFVTHAARFHYHEGMLVQHAFMPLTFDAKFMAFRLLSSVPHSVFQTLLYLRLRRLVPFAIAHALMGGARALIGVLLPLMRG